MENKLADVYLEDEDEFMDDDTDRGAAEYKDFVERYYKDFDV